MAKKQLSNPHLSNPQSWEQINDLLKRLGELTVRKRTLENEKTELLSEITARFDAEAAPVLAEMKTVEETISAFVLEHKDEFVKSRTKELSHGSISMRVSTSVKIISRAICLKVLNAMGMHDFINVKETPNKDMLASLSDVELAKLSCEKKTVDNISIEPKIEEITNPELPS